MEDYNVAQHSIKLLDVTYGVLSLSDAVFVKRDFESPIDITYGPLRLGSSIIRKLFSNDKVDNYSNMRPHTLRYDSACFLYRGDEVLVLSHGKSLSVGTGEIVGNLVIATVPNPFLFEDMSREDIRCILVKQENRRNRMVDAYLNGDMKIFGRKVNPMSITPTRLASFLLGREVGLPLNSERNVVIG